MDLKDRLRRGLEHSRGFTEAVIEEIERPEDWLLRPTAGSNHAMWIVGHLAYADNSFTRLAAPARVDSREDYKRLFGMGSAPTEQLGDYPPVEEVLAYFRSRREAMMEALADMTLEDFDKPTPEQAPSFLYDIGSVFQMGAWHEALHAGQLTVIHRALGKQPLAGR